MNNSLIAWMSHFLHFLVSMASARTHRGIPVRRLFCKLLPLPRKEQPPEAKPKFGKYLHGLEWANPSLSKGALQSPTKNPWNPAHSARPRPKAPPTANDESPNSGTDIAQRHAHRHTNILFRRIHNLYNTYLCVYICICWFMESIKTRHTIDWARGRQSLRKWFQHSFLPY